MLGVYTRLFEQAYFEIGEAFKGLADENVWKRPAEGLLSVGELAGHMAYWEAIRLAGEGEDLSKCKVSSPLIDPRFRYHPDTVATPTAGHPAMTAEQVNVELLRVHKEALAHFEVLNPDLDSAVPGLQAGGGSWRYRDSVEYLLFHLAYHTGQIFTARHLLGEKTADN